MTEICKVMSRFVMSLQKCELERVDKPRTKFYSRCIGSLQAHYQELIFYTNVYSSSISNKNHKR